MEQRRRSLNHALTLSALCVWLCVGCGGSTPSGQTPSALEEEESLSSPQAKALEESLRDIEQRAATLRVKIDGAQGTVSEHMKPEDLSALTYELETGSTYMEIDASSILRVNGIVMSRDDFGRFVERRGTQLCKPTPILIIDPDAEYDLVAWVLERMYAQSCANIDVVEHSPGKKEG